MLDELRKKIDAVDDKIVALYNERMKLVKQVGLEKAKKNIAVSDGSREKAILERVEKASDAEIKEYTPKLFEALFETAKIYQSALTATQGGNGNINPAAGKDKN